MLYCAYAWLGRESLVQTFDEDNKVDIQEIRELIDEASEDDEAVL
jgi:hypothetical protein